MTTSTMNLIYAALLDFGNFSPSGQQGPGIWEYARSIPAAVITMILANAEGPSEGECARQSAASSGLSSLGTDQQPSVRYGHHMPSTNER